MVDRYTRLRIRRGLRRKQKQALDISDQATEHFDKHLLRRIPKLGVIARFLVGWTVLIALSLVGLALQWRNLGAHYQVDKPIAGGSYHEGVIGVYTNSSPVYATAVTDTALSKLLYSGLLAYDDSNKLVNDIALNWEVDAKGVVYTVHLRPDVLWHDGQKLTASDVVFTIKTIQNPDARSPLNSSWQGVVVEAQGDFTVVFRLPNPLASFVYSLTQGIVPKHILAKVPVAQLRSDLFNSVSPIGSGPFSWDTIITLGTNKDDLKQVISLKSFSKYHRGKPKLDQFVIHTYPTEDMMRTDLFNLTLHGASGLPISNAEMNKYRFVTLHNFPLTSSVMLFLNNSKEILKDVKVRRALAQMTDEPALLAELGYPVRSVDEPLLLGQTGYNKTLKQLPLNIAQSMRLLDEDGWLRDPVDGWRKKAGKNLELNIVSQNTPEYTTIIQALQLQWRSLGVKLNPNLQPSDSLQENYIIRHDYDILLYGLSIGPDPDVFAYWHSSQASSSAINRLNLSEWKNSIADQALEAGRTRLDPSLRTIKYKPFLESWQKETPAIGLYQPRMPYTTTTKVYGLNDHQINMAADRYDNVHNWMILKTRASE